MNIGFDIDDTLTDLKVYNKAFCEKEFKLTGKNYKVINENSGFIKEMYSWSASEFDEFWHKVKQQFLENLPVRENAKITLETLKKHGHKIIIITRRFTNNPYERSEKWLKKNNLPYDKLIVNAGNKIDACKQNKIDFFIDDDIKTCENLNKNGIKAVVMNNVFNVNNKTTSPRVNSLEKFLHIVLNYENEPEL